MLLNIKQTQTIKEGTAKSQFYFHVLLRQPPIYIFLHKLVAFLFIRPIKGSPL